MGDDVLVQEMGVVDEQIGRVVDGTLAQQALEKLRRHPVAHVDLAVEDVPDRGYEMIAGLLLGQEPARTGT